MLCTVWSFFSIYVWTGCTGSSKAPPNKKTCVDLFGHGLSCKPWTNHYLTFRDLVLVAPLSLMAMGILSKPQHFKSIFGPHEFKSHNDCAPNLGQDST